MKGDFSKWTARPTENYTGVLHQQGRVLLDADWNEERQIEAFLRETLGQDVIGAGVLAAPAGELASFRVREAKVVGDQVSVTLEPGRGWVDGILVSTPSPATDLPGSYLPPPFNAAGVSVADIKEGVRDVVVLEVWEESVSGFQDTGLLEPALAGPDTTERVRAGSALRLLRLDADEDCAAVAARGQDDVSKLGKLSVTPAPALVIAGDCPLEAGGGYTGFEHYLYRIEVGQPKAGQPRVKWSQFNGGLVGRGKFDSGARTATIDANNQAINHSGLTGFYLEALTRNPLGGWDVVYAAAATLVQDDVLALTDDWGTFPAAGVSTFFRLWNGIVLVTDFPTGLVDPKELNDGLRLAFDPPAADLSNYRPGDYWTFPVRAAGVPLDTSTWPSNSPPQGVVYHRVPLAVIEWQADRTASYTEDQIDDCRKVFQPLSNQQACCCSYTVGDGTTTHGDFDSIAEALAHLPRAGGHICLLTGVHEAGVTLTNRFNVTIRGCGLRTKVVPAAARANDPLFRVLDSQEVTLEAMDMATLGGVAVHVSGSKAGACQRIEIRDNRILAGALGIRVENASFANIHENRIRMLDREGAGVAIYVLAEDSVIERNEITVIPAPSVPPIDVPGEDGSVTPTDPCARLEGVYRVKKILSAYLNLLWQVLVPLLPRDPYVALSGIQVAAGTERLSIVDNCIAGGAGNGISLGGRLEEEAPPPPTDGQNPPPTVGTFRGVIEGRVVGSDGKTMPGVQLAFTNTATGGILQAVSDANGAFAVQGAEGKYTVQATSAGFTVDKVDAVRTESAVQRVVTVKPVQARPDDALAFLYDLRIARNDITGMGLCGIGLAPLPTRLTRGPGLALAAAPLLQFLAQYGNPILGLLIEANRITRCLRNPFDEAMRALSQRRGLGGISLGLCEDLTIADNLIEGNGLSHLDPVCGIYVGFGEEVEITRNRIVSNGPLVPLSANAELQTGMRGGVVVAFASATSLAGILTAEGQPQSSGRPAARIHENLVDQPAGQALTLGAFGPVACSDNSFTAEVSGPRDLDQLAGAVLIFNLGGVQTAGAGTRIAAAAVAVDLATQPAPSNQPAGAAGAAPEAAAAGPTLYRRVGADFVRPAASLRIMPGGYTLFADNQSRTGSSNRSVTCHALVALDDLGYQGNQSYSYRIGNLFSNAYLLGGTLRASGNRLSEAGAETLMSLYSLGMRMNDTSLNQGDHCIVATDMNPAIAVAQVGNQVLHPSRLCNGLNMISDLMFKAQG